VEPFLNSSGRRDLREKAFRAFTARGDMATPTTNNATLVEILALREESARIMGFPTYAPTAWKTPWPRRPRQCEPLERVWKPRGLARSPIAMRCRG